jgi:hypothetical protein
VIYPFIAGAVSDEANHPPGFSKRLLSAAGGGITWLWANIGKSRIRKMFATLHLKSQEF